jgi:hypothetical protein
MRWRAVSSFGLATSLLLSGVSLALLLTVRDPAPIGAALDRSGGGTTAPAQVAPPGGQPNVNVWSWLEGGLPSDPAWQSLPGVGISGDAFLAQCPQGQSLAGFWGRHPGAE